MDISRKGEWRIVGINTDNNPEQAENFLREHGNPYSALSVPKGRIQGFPLSGGIPLIYVISANGIILSVHYGAPLPAKALLMN
jgi:hypothetical protein